MQLFNCDNCHRPVLFENTHCLNCGSTLGFLPATLTVSAIAPVADGRWRAIATPGAGDTDFKMCGNYGNESVCNWMLNADSEETFCRACRLNEIIPDLSVEGNRERWHRLELAKRRLVYTLIRLGLGFAPGAHGHPEGLRFAFLAPVAESEGEKDRSVITGHENGLVTINAAEADKLVLEAARLNMRERYRTLLGHFRHETGHFYWDALIADSRWLTPFRDLFGDEREDYAKALERYYAHGPAGNWQERTISEYASSHPWEDWAESWAHYLHMVDTLETAWAFGLRLRVPELNEPLPKNPGPDASFDALTENWFALTFAMNSISRSMGFDDYYPFVLSQPVLDKLEFIHHVIDDARTGAPAGV